MIPCTVCGEESRNIASLQIHILAKHCSQSDSIIQMLKRQENTMINMQHQITLIAAQVAAPKNWAPQAPLQVPTPQAQIPPALAPRVAPTVSYAAMAGPPNPPPGPRRNIRTISYVTDSIGGNVMIDELEKITKTKFKKKRAYGAVKALGQTYPVSNFTDVVPKEMAENKPDVLVLQRDSVTLTDMSGPPRSMAGS